MDKLFVFFFLCFGSVYSETQIETNKSKDLILVKMDTASMFAPSMTKIKRLAWPIHTTPCPPYWPYYNKGLHMTQRTKVQFIQPPTYSVKPIHQGWQTKNSWQLNSAWKHNEWSMPSNGWSVASIGWSKPSNRWQSSNWQPAGWQPKVIVQKPVQSYLPQYQKPLYHDLPNYQHNLIKPSVMSDCPPYTHQHLQQTGIVYAPQHQYHTQPHIKYHHEPQYVKVEKPIYQSLPPLYHPPSLYHHSQSIPTSQIEVCDK